MIKNIIFDMGQVIIDFDGNTIFDPFLPKPIDPEDRKLMIQACFESHLWETMDSGETSTEADLIEPMCALLPKRLHPAMKSMLLHWHEHIVTRDDTFHLMKELKANGYHLYLLSNAGNSFQKYAPFIRAFRFLDGKVVSAFHFQVKPHAEIYQTLFSSFNLNPQECIFIDDVPRNIEGAKSQGMDGIVYDGNMSKLRLALHAKGIQVQCDPMFISVNTSDQIQEIAVLSAEIQHECLSAFISTEQIDYMLEKFQSEQAIKNQIDQGYQYYFITSANKNIGFFAVYPEECKLYLSELYILKEFRGKGYASNAMKFIESIGEQHGLASVYLNCHQQNNLSINAYHQMGFTTVKKMIADIGSGFFMDNNIMEKSI